MTGWNGKADRLELLDVDLMHPPHGLDVLVEDDHDVGDRGRRKFGLFRLLGHQLVITSPGRVLVGTKVDLLPVELD